MTITMLFILTYINVLALLGHVWPLWYLHLFGKFDAFSIIFLNTAGCQFNRKTHEILNLFPVELNFFCGIRLRLEYFNRAFYIKNFIQNIHTQRKYCAKFSNVRNVIKKKKKPKCLHCKQNSNANRIKKLNCNECPYAWHCTLPALCTIINLFN